MAARRNDLKNSKLCQADSPSKQETIACAQEENKNPNRSKKNGLPWYREGLRFQCTGCGACCTGSPGYVWVTEEEIKKIATYLKITPEEFRSKYTKRVHDRISLKELPRSYDCVFLQGRRCTIYPVRPKQCVTFPWWKENLESSEQWEHAARYCEGINHKEAPLVSLKEIQSQST